MSAGFWGWEELTTPGIFMSWNCSSALSQDRNLEDWKSPRILNWFLLKWNSIFTAYSTRFDQSHWSFNNSLYWDHINIGLETDIADGPWTLDQCLSRDRILTCTVSKDKSWGIRNHQMNYESSRFEIYPLWCIQHLVRGSCLCEDQWPILTYVQWQSSLAQRSTRHKQVPPWQQAMLTVFYVSPTASQLLFTALEHKPIWRSIILYLVDSSDRYGNKSVKERQVIYESFQNAIGHILFRCRHGQISCLDGSTSTHR